MINKINKKLATTSNYRINSANTNQNRIYAPGQRQPTGTETYIHTQTINSCSQSIKQMARLLATAVSWCGCHNYPDNCDRQPAANDRVLANYCTIKMRFESFLLIGRIGSGRLIAEII